MKFCMKFSYYDPIHAKYRLYGIHTVILVLTCKMQMIADMYIMYLCVKAERSKCQIMNLFGFTISISPRSKFGNSLLLKHPGHWCLLLHHFLLGINLPLFADFSVYVIFKIVNSCDLLYILLLLFIID